MASYDSTPLAVLPTPKHLTGKTDAFTREASHMALSHNAFIRGFNSIYLQAPSISPADKSDFVQYCLAWHDVVKAHHHYEETEFFPAVEAAAGVKGLMDTAVHEHELFYDGLARFSAYLHRSDDFDPAELCAVMDSFKDALHAHLTAEPDAIVALARHSTADRPIDILALADAAGKKQLSLGFVFNTLPVFLLNMETATFEDGMWHDVFPPLRGLLKGVMTQGVPLWHAAWWRFCSCNPDGTMKTFE